jgi:hypothetical protein
VVAPGKIITTGSGLKAFQQTYYDYSQNSNVIDMNTVIIDGKSGIEYMLTYRAVVIQVRLTQLRLDVFIIYCSFSILFAPTPRISNFLHGISPPLCMSRDLVIQIFSKHFDTQFQSNTRTICN